MKKISILIMLCVLCVSCAKDKMVKYNTARIDNIETYLKNHKYVKPSENLDKLVEEGKVGYSEDYEPLLKGGLKNE
ncbi:hypothetical protein RN96_14770 [Fusobacterium polymorphum]|uniref:Uncharacterized protein n=1 Tax=Fusobacterium nucleatum subsp. polymorphum TaxID=76857 RepID=A0A2B7YEU8_FUSNP|nr:hypothetical protein [Fusobacterium polymorphum]PGH19402.1 hypothetical protein RN96_14770 [Fusobacterium polymorphum]